MTEKTLAPPIRRYAPVVLAGCGVLALWLGPTVWLHERQHLTIMEVKHDLGQRLDRVEVRLDHLSGRLDQVILLLGGGPE